VSLNSIQTKKPLSSVESLEFVDEGYKYMYMYVPIHKVEEVVGEDYYQCSSCAQIAT